MRSPFSFLPCCVVPARIISVDGPREVTRGEDAQFTCSARGHPLPTVSWQFTSVEGDVNEFIHLDTLQDDVKKKYQLSTRLNGSLTMVSTLSIVNADTSTSGKYTCLALNSYRLEDRDVMLNVRGRQIHDARFQSGHCVRNTPIFSISCVGGQFSSQWLPFARFQSLLDRIGNACTCNYVCMVHCEVLTAMVLIVVNTTCSLVVVPPYGLSTRQSAVAVRAGEAVILQCLSKGSQPLKFAWYRHSNGGDRQQIKHEESGGQPQVRIKSTSVQNLQNEMKYWTTNALSNTLAFSELGNHLFWSSELVVWQNNWHKIREPVAEQ